MPEPDLESEARHSPHYSTDYADLLTPGVVVELTPDEADALGAFEETAISEADAWAGNADVEAV